MDILSLLMNFLASQKETALGGAKGFLDAASRYGSFGEAAKNFPQFLKGFEQTQGAFPRTPTIASMTPMGQPETPPGAPAGFTEPSSGFESTLVNPNAPAQLKAREAQASQPVSPIRGMFNMLLGKQQPEIAGTEPVFPEYKPTPEQAESHERTLLSKEGRELQKNTAFQNVIKGFVIGNRPEEPELRQEEIDMLSKGIRPPGLTPRPSASVEEVREQQKVVVRRGLGDPSINYDISKLPPALQVLGMDNNMFKKEGDKWMFSKEEQAKIEEPKTVKYHKGGQEVTEIYRKPGAAAETVTAPRQLAPIETDKPLEEAHTKGLYTEATREWFPIITKRIEEKYKDLAEVRKILQGMARDPYTGQIQLYELTPHMTSQEQKTLDRQLQIGTQLMKNKKLSSPEAWAGAKKTVHFKEGNIDFDIPVSEVGAFQKLHPKAKRVEE